MSGVWKRSKVQLVRHRQTKGPVTDRLNLNRRATPRLHTKHQILYNEWLAMSMVMLLVSGTLNQNQELSAILMEAERLR
jgi:hypothetical protein